MLSPLQSTRFKSITEAFRVSFSITSPMYLNFLLSYCIGEVMDTDNVFFDRMRESEHGRRNLRLQQEQEAQQVPNLIWNYSVTQRILPHTLDNSLEDGEVGKPLSSDPVEEGGSAEAAADLVVETEPDSKMPDGNTGDTETGKEFCCFLLNLFWC